MADKKLKPIGTGKIRAKIIWDEAKCTVGISLTDTETGQTIVADIDATTAMTVGDTMFKKGADMRALKASRETLG